MATEPRDVFPDTATARALKGVTADPRELPIEAATCKPKRFIKVPDGPGAPTCKPKRFITGPGPGCKPSKFIKVPEPKKSPTRDALPGWAKELGQDLVERFQ